jgi:hypothetical protein
MEIECSPSTFWMYFTLILLYDAPIHNDIQAQLLSRNVRVAMVVYLCNVCGVLICNVSNLFLLLFFFI